MIKLANIYLEYILDSRMHLEEGCRAPCTRHFSWNRQDLPSREKCNKNNLTTGIWPPEYRSFFEHLETGVKLLLSMFRDVNMYIITLQMFLG